MTVIVSKINTLPFEFAGLLINFFPCFVSLTVLGGT